MGELAADQPIRPCAQQKITGPVAKTPSQGGEKPDFLHGRRITEHQMIAAHAELAPQREVPCLHALDAAPRQVRAIHAAEAGEVAAIDGATSTLLPARAAALNAPLIPPPTTITSNC